jgi:hypothetical protein
MPQVYVYAIQVKKRVNLNLLLAAKGFIILMSNLFSKLRRILSLLGNDANQGLEMYAYMYRLFKSTLSEENLMALSL